MTQKNDHDKLQRVIKHAKVTHKRVQLKPIQSFREDSNAPIDSQITSTPTIPHNPNPTPKEVPVYTNTSKYVSEEEFEKQKRQKLTQLEKDIETQRKTAFDHIEQEKAQLFENARNEGYAAGYEEAQEAFKKKSDELFEHINALAKKRKQVLKNAEREVLDLAIAVAKKIIQGELATHPDQFTHIFEEALMKITQKDEVMVKVNPKDADAVRSYIDTHKKALSDIKRLEIYEDPDIEKGGCVIETRLGYIDSSISTKLDIIGQALNDEFDEYLIDPDGTHALSVGNDDFESEEIDSYTEDEDVPEDLGMSDF